MGTIVLVRPQSPQLSYKLRSGTSHKKCLMLRQAETIFWDKKGPVKVDFADSKTRINSEYYCQLMKEVRFLRRKLRNQRLWLLHDNAPIKDIKPRQCTTAFSYCLLVICLYLYLCSDSIHIQISTNERLDGKKLPTVEHHSSNSSPHTCTQAPARNHTFHLLWQR